MENKLSFWGYLIWAGVGFAIFGVIFKILLL